MSGSRLAKVGGFTVVAAAIATTAAKALGQNNAINLQLYNAGSNAVFVNSGNSAVTVVYPTSSVGQNGSIIPPGVTMPYMKNNSSDTHLGVICDTGLTTTLFITSTDGE